MARSIIFFFVLICLKNVVVTKTIKSGHDVKLALTQVDSELSDCPNNRYVLYGSPPKCHLIGERGPCDIGQKLLRNSNSDFGVCTCDCFENLNFDASMLQFCNDGELQKYVYLPTQRKCFRLGGQGPCKVGGRLVKSLRNNGGQLFCVKKGTTSRRKRNANESTTEGDGKAASASMITMPCGPDEVYSSLFNMCMRRRRSISSNGIVGR